MGPRPNPFSIPPATGYTTTVAPLPEIQASKAEGFSQGQLFTGHDVEAESGSWQLLHTSALSGLKQGAAFAEGFVTAHPIATEMAFTFAVAFNPAADLALGLTQAISVFTTGKTIFGNPADTMTDKVLAVAGVMFPVAQLKAEIGAFARALNPVNATPTRIRQFLFPAATDEATEKLAHTLR